VETLVGHSAEGPDGLYGNTTSQWAATKAAKLKAIREALRMRSGSGWPPIAIAKAS